MSPRLKLSCPAKVNLSLEVLGKRPDGFHELSGLMCPISVFDELELKIDISPGDTSPGDEGPGEAAGEARVALSCPNTDLPIDRENLVFRAAEEFLKLTGTTGSVTRVTRVAMVLRKNIPVSAGLGGGSSDAATVLMGLNSLMGSLLGDEELKRAALSLGSDVPFFLLKSPAIACGRGEVLEPIPPGTLPELFFLLINPGFPVSASWAYGELDRLGLTKKAEDNTLKHLMDSLAKGSLGKGSLGKGSLGKGEATSGLLRNDLEGPVLRKYPALVELKALLCDAGAAAALLSGSGPTVFGLFFDEKKAKEAFKSIQAHLKEDHGKEDQAKPPMKILLAKGLV